jgi:hypothetical protein
LAPWTGAGLQEQHRRPASGLSAERKHRWFDNRHSQIAAFEGRNGVPQPPPMWAVERTAPYLSVGAHHHPLDVHLRRPPACACGLLLCEVGRYHGPATMVELPGQRFYLPILFIYYGRLLIRGHSIRRAEGSPFGQWQRWPGVQKVFGRCWTESRYSFDGFDTKVRELAASALAESFNTRGGWGKQEWIRTRSRL